MTQMHPLARSGFDASGASGLYDRARPSYPPQAIEALLAAPQPPVAEGARFKIAELGAGTGICTRVLLDTLGSARLERLTAVEPSQGMREGWETAVRPLAQRAAGEAKVQCIEGSFESFDAGSDNDAVIVAQAWHWTRDFDGAIAECAKALRPGGVLALLWNLEDRDGAAWVGGVRDLYEVHEAGTPQYRHMYWRDPTNNSPSMAAFEKLEPQHWTRTIPTTVEGVKDRILSKSYITVLPKEEQEKLAAAVGQLLADEKTEKTWIDKEAGTFEYPYRTDLFLFRKK